MKTLLQITAFKALQAFLAPVNLALDIFLGSLKVARLVTSTVGWWLKEETELLWFSL